ncbi:auxin response factor 2A-like isoform X1 [Malus domestica]|uniref:auxin response factor 2A-like isoform X1 n=1 Tax=Malus domestica TaxID=3750 RepID=UPI0007ECE863
MAVSLDTGVPWVMCQQDDAPASVICFDTHFSKFAGCYDDIFYDVEASTNQLADQQMPVYNLASKILCRVINVSLKVEPDTDELFAQLTYFPNQMEA